MSVQMATNVAVQRAPGRLFELDLLRLVAALMVVCHHYFGQANARDRSSLSFGDVFSYSPLVEKFAAVGVLGVDVFFIISGFVIALSAQGRGPKEFVLSRASRILPAFFFCCVLTWAALRLDGTYRQVTLGQLFANLFFVASPLGYQFVDGVYWSLVIEIRFYLLVVLLVAMGWFRHYHWILLGWLVLSAIDALTPIPRVLRVIFMPQFAHYFIAGGALFFVYVNRHRKIAYGLLIGSTLLACYRVYEKASPGQPDVALAFVAVVLFAVFALWFIAVGRAAPFARSWMVHLGALTYPLYLLHQDLGFLFFRHFPWIGNGGLITSLAIGWFLLLAFVLHRMVERPVAAWIRRLGSKNKTKDFAVHA